MATNDTLVYLILGPSGSGRREILADLLETGLDEGEKAAVLVAQAETDSPAMARISARADVIRWSWHPAGKGDAGKGAPVLEGTIEADPPGGAGRVFFLADGRANPVDQVEAFKVWLADAGLTLARILCVVDCRLAEAHPPLLAWYDACVHFADVVLLNRRDGVSNKWISGFQARFKGEHFPCLVEVVKHGAVRNPALVLEPQALRISHAFDEEAGWPPSVGPETAVLDEAADDEEEAGEEGDELQPEEDPYFARRAGGRRVKEIPDIAKFL